MKTIDIKFNSNIKCMHCEHVVLKGHIVKSYDSSKSWMCPKCECRTSVVENLVDVTGSELKASKVLISAYHAGADNKGRLVSKTEQDISELHSLIDEAISYGYYIQVVPSSALADEHKENRNLLLMFSSKGMTQR